jgi:hypothetical protein
MWQSPFITLPNDQQTVWIRVTAIYGELAIAVYTASTKTFETVSTGVEIPAYQVARWKVHP